MAKKGSEELRKAFSEENKRRWRDPEYKKRVSESMKGRIGCMTGKTHSEESRKKTSAAMTGKCQSKEIIEKRRLKQIGRKMSPECKKKMSVIFTRLRQDPEYKKHMKEKWLDPDYVRNVMLGRRITPNKPEKLIFELLESLYPGQWKYTGDFSFTINGKCPDFVNCNGQKKVIELFGDYWHEGQDPQDRIDIFKPFGFDTLVIWEHELKNRDDVAMKIQVFHENRENESR